MKRAFKGVSDGYRLIVFIVKLCINMRSAISTSPSANTNKTQCYQNVP